MFKMLTKYQNGSSASHGRKSDLVLDAISESQAVIEFELDGTILTANANFLNTLGYSLEEIQGKNHSMFVEPEYRDCHDYREFWEKLSRGEYQSAEYKRIAKGGKEIWIQASYNPILDRSGKPCKVVKFATDVTEQKMQTANFVGQIEAICKSQAVIEFELDGTILTANVNFLNTLGYSLEEIQGKNHSMFVEPEYRDCPDYREFWEKLRQGEYQSAEYKRIAKGGKEIWIQASYNPILDLNGKPYKVVKFATDVTEQKMQTACFAGQIAAIYKSQAVIEFELDGTILTANENFLNALGYSLEEIQGRHHSMFVEPEYRDCPDYREFWEKLSRGEFQSAEYKRITKDGKEIWIQASYNPILDLNGKPSKVVKFATDVTDQVIKRIQGEHVTGIMQNVASGAEELGASVQEISGSMHKSRETVEIANREVQNANESAQNLTDATGSLGGIVEAINEITEKINLLALNATIEAARAGEAGKGFAVVASEVKSLAHQAKGATERISEEIDSMRIISDDVVSTLNLIRTSIDSVTEYVTSTASAVEEQVAVTNEMTVNMQKAASEAAKL